MLRADLGVVLALAVAVVLTGCGVEETDLNYPPVETRYTVAAETVDCRGTVDERLEPPDAPVTHVCTWERVTVDGVPACAAILAFRRAGISSPWYLAAAYTTTATHCL